MLHIKCYTDMYVDVSDTLIIQRYVDTMITLNVEDTYAELEKCPKRLVHAMKNNKFADHDDTRGRETFSKLVLYQVFMNTVAHRIWKSQSSLRQFKHV